MKIYKRPTWIVLLLLAYVTGMACYFVPRNQEMTATEKWIAVAVAYGLVLVLWLVMQYREHLRRKGCD